MNSQPKYEPALIIGAIMSIIAGIGQAVDAQAGTPFNVWKFVIALLPLVAGLGIRSGVVSRSWLVDVVEASTTDTDVASKVAEEVGTRPSN